MLTDFSIFFKDNNLSCQHDRTLLAVSGGVDSVVMADLFHKTGFPFAIAHANFQLRGNESIRDEMFVRKLAEKYKVDFYVRHFDTAGYARKNKVSIQVAARDLRYRWFNDLLSKLSFDHIATAHHLDDQAETFLINLARGAGIAGLHGIALKQGKVIRPMMFTGRKEIEAYATENHLEFVEDSSNKSLKYTRNRIRHKIIPELEKINASFRERLNETITNIQEAEIIFKKAIADTGNSIFNVRGDVISIPVKDFYALEPLRTYAFELLAPYGFSLANVCDIIGLRDSIPGKEVVSPTHRLVRDRDHLLIVPKHESGKKSECQIDWIDLKNPVKYPVHLSFEIIDKIPADLKVPHNFALLDLEKLVFPLLIRKWRRGDVFIPLGIPGPKKLSDFFIDMKFSTIEKENQWLLCSGDDIAWVIGKRIDDRYKITGQSIRILKICANPP
jgi:tRNA(Ile)-lysidine synthase